MSATAPNYLKLLAAQQEEAVAKAYFTYTVPITVDAPLRVRAEFNPLDSEAVYAFQKKMEDAKPGAVSHVAMVQHSGLIAKSCRRIWLETQDGTQIPMRVDWETNPEGYTRFDAKAAEFLGMPDPERATAHAVIKKIFVHDLEIIGASALIQKKSGAVEQEADDDLAGK